MVDTTKVTAIILAGGEGSRADPLTRYRAKPAIPIGGVFRLADVVVSDFLNSDIRRINVIVQKRPQSLMIHLDGFRDAVAPMRGQFIRCLPPPKNEDRFYLSDLDSLRHHFLTWENDASELVVLAMGDQVAKIDFRQVIIRFLETGADVIMVYNRVPVAQAANRLGVIECEGDRVTRMAEKPEVPEEIPSDPGYCRGNLAMYVMRKELFLEMLRKARRADWDPALTLSKVGVPWLIGHARVVTYDLSENIISGLHPCERAAFFEVGTPDDYFDAQMAFCRREPTFNFYNEAWPIWTSLRFPIIPAKVDRVQMEEVLLAPNVVVQDDVELVRTVVSFGSVVGSGSRLQNTVVLDGAKIGRNCRITDTVIEKGIIVPDNTVISADSVPDNESIVLSPGRRVFLPKFFEFKQPS
ncbi:MAG: sugar phosphate nucleotidyltransferase [Patescibacteria group bacterium]